MKTQTQLPPRFHCPEMTVILRLSEKEFCFPGNVEVLVNSFFPDFMAIYTPKPNMAMEKTPFENVSPIKHSDFPFPC